MDGYEGSGPWSCSCRKCHPNLADFGKLIPEIWGGRKCAGDTGQLWHTRNKQWLKSGLGGWITVATGISQQMMKLTIEFANSAGNSVKEKSKDKSPVKATSQLLSLWIQMT